MKKKFLIIFSIILIFLQLSPVYALITTDEAEIEKSSIVLEAEGAILIDASTGEILFEKNIEQKFYPASITKLMTVLLALENANLDDVVTFSHDAVFSIEPGSSHIAVDFDEQLTLEQSLYAIMLRSANEVSNGVGEHVAGSMDNFAVMMTERAKELGATATNFTNASGLHDENHYTTAKDMALIAKELLNHEFFHTVSSSTYYEIPPTNKQPEIRYLHGQNQLQKESSSFYYEFCFAGKNGFTNEAGNTLVSYAKQGDTTLISVVLKSSGYGSYTDTISLFEYGFNNFETIELSAEGEVATTIDVIETQKRETLELGAVELKHSNRILATVPKGTLKEDVVSTNTIVETYEAPIYANDVIGKSTFTLNGTEIGTYDLIATKTLLPSTLAEPVGDDVNPINVNIVIILLVICCIALIVVRIAISRIQAQKRKQRRRERLKKFRELYENQGDN